MDIGQAFSMFHVGAIDGAQLTERNDEKGSCWVVELKATRSLPSHLSLDLETSRGGQKVFRHIDSAIKDLKTIGVTEITLTLLPK